MKLTDKKSFENPMCKQCLEKIYMQLSDEHNQTVVRQFSSSQMQLEALYEHIVGKQVQGEITVDMVVEIYKEYLDQQTSKHQWRIVSFLLVVAFALYVMFEKGLVK